MKPATIRRSRDADHADAQAYRAVAKLVGVGIPGLKLRAVDCRHCVARNAISKRVSDH